ncbi:hypothetical protein JCM5350_001397 [Sporobolomyces pararoseus]
MSLIHLLLPDANFPSNYDSINMEVDFDSVMFKRATVATGELKGTLAAVYSSIALLSVAGWDTLLCLRIEYLTIWRARSSFLKWLYLATRYLGLITGGVLVGACTSPAFSESTHCNVMVKVTMALVTITCFARLLLRSYRIVAIYRFNHLLIGVLTSASLLTTIIQGYFISEWIAQSLSPPSSGCFPVPNPASGEKSLVLFDLFWDDGARFQAMLFSVNLTIFILSCRLVHSLRPQSRPTPITSSAQGDRPENRQDAEPNYLCGEFGSIQSQINRRLLPINVGPEESTVQPSLETPALQESYISQV